MVVVRRPMPECGHSYLRDCPLTVEDWEKVWLALVGFKQQCALIAEEAHCRADAAQDDATRGRGIEQREVAP